MGRLKNELGAMLSVVMLVHLALFAAVASQPIFYLMAMGRAQRALSPPAYIELRHQLNHVMTKRVPVLYVATLVTTLSLMFVAFRSGAGLVLGTTLVALACLVADVIFMTREAIPINSVVDRWSTTDFPANWESYREKWFAIFKYREIVLLIGFSSLLIGAVLG
jgi:hypothetical protein